MTKHRAKPHSKAQPPAKQPAKQPTGSSGKQSAKQPAKGSARKPVKRERGILLTMALAFVILHGVIWTALSFGLRKQDDPNFPILIGLLLAASAASVVAGIAMWFWKRWGIILYFVAGVVVAALALLVTGSIWMLFGSLMQTVVVLYVIYTKLKLFE